MKGIFWNSRGLRDLAKPNFLCDLSNDYDLDFIALLETHKRNFTDVDLNSYCGGREYHWQWCPPKGRSGGILLGVNKVTFDVQESWLGEFIVKMKVKNKDDGFCWALMAVYGAAQPEHKDRFLAEFVNTCSNESLPILIGGDFNIIRSPQEKSNDRYDSRWPNLFNACIQTLNLRELEMEGRKFTWVIAGENPTFEKLDRILVSSEWEQKFPLASVQALSRENSDHTPLLLQTGNASFRGKSQRFRFELGWLHRDGFQEMVAEVWNREVRWKDALEKWQNRIRAVRKYLRGWSKHSLGEDRKKKKLITLKLDALDKKSESYMLSTQELEQKSILSFELSKMRRKEELYWAQRAKAGMILQGDDNTKFFHLLANGRYRKTRITQLEQEEGIIVGQ